MKLKFSFSLWPGALLLMFLSCLSLRSEASATYAGHVCPNLTTADVYASNSVFRTNLNLLLSVLSSNSKAEAGFYNATAGRSTNATVYGLFLCRGDLSPEACQACVANAAREVVGTYCPREKTVVIWYDECMIRYSDQSMFSIVDRTYQKILNNNETEKDPEGIMRLLGEVMPDLALRAASGSGSPEKKFGVAQTNYSGSQTLYATAQCTPDITVPGCTTCLQDAISSIPNCCRGNSGVRIFLPSCNIRYEKFLFYNNTGIPPTPPPPPPRPTSATPPGKGRIPTNVLIPIIVSVSVTILLIVGASCFMRKKMMMIIKKKKKKKYLPVGEDNTVSNVTTESSWQFDFATIQAATDNFSDSNKLGEGGFGCVYKGILSNGRAIAVKRLSKNSRQGGEEFKNEVTLVAKLQHRNLVKMFGYCLEGKEKILIYEYVPNRSLDCILFDPKRKGELDWSKRYKIIKGIARGVLYLHEDSQLRIIHRDLKASNILLDKDMNAKISDFGLARIFGVDQTKGSTSKVVGTYGYMSPEYVLRGYFSTKSDVFSFGVLVLEIISGNKNSNFNHSDINSLLSYAWRLWKNGTPLEIVDPTLGQSYPKNEVLKCLDIALSCVQDNPDARPSMATIVVMFNSNSWSKQAPQQPTIFSRRTMVLSETSESDKLRAQSSVNDLSVTQLYPR